MAARYTPPPARRVQHVECPPPEALTADPDAARRHHVVSGPRCWWASQVWLPPDERPVDLGEMLAALASLARGGVTFMAAGVGDTTALPPHDPLRS